MDFNQDWTLEQLATIMNLAKATYILKELGHDDLMPTMIELLYLETQNMIDEHCVQDGGHERERGDNPEST